MACGRKNANCEILVKEALKEAEKLGAEVEFARMLELDIKSCKVCWPCPVIMKGAEHCIHKDDGAWLYNKLMDCDGFLLAAPCYSLTPPGQLIAIRDRIMGPRCDVASMNEAKKMAGVDPKFEKFGGMEIDDRLFRRKVGAMISVGGALSEHWVSLCLASMQTLMFPAQYNVVDQMNVIGVAEDGAITLQEKLLERARELGKNMVLGFESDSDRKPFLGKEKNICPICHQGLMMMNLESNRVDCAVCGIAGEIEMENGKVKVIFTEEQQAESRHYYQGLLLHHLEVMKVSKSIEDRKNELSINMESYKEYNKWKASPRGKVL